MRRALLLPMLFPFAAAAQAPHAADAQQPARYLVGFAERGFDLEALRVRIRAGDAAGAAREVARLEVLAAGAHEDFARRLAQAGGSVEQRYWLIDAWLVTIGAELAAEVARWPGVLAVHEDRARAPGAMPIRTSTNAQNHRTDAVQASGVRGAGVTVAVLDTGFDSDVGGIGRPHRIFFLDGNTSNTGSGGIGGSRMLANVQVGALPADNPITHGTKVAGVAIGGRWGTGNADHGHAPHAGFAGYAISDDQAGNAFLSTMVMAWQRMVADAARLGTRVASLSYEGTYTALSPEQQAIDAAVVTADLFVAVMAGNSPASPFFYQGNVNALAAGSVSADAHVLSGFSARGPLVDGQVTRLYPHLVANGEALVLPQLDNENVDDAGTGTSYAAPAVAGAGALFRSRAPTATSEQTRAAILATTEDVSAQNAGNLAAIGHGYLRVDRLIALADGAGLLRSGRVDVVRRQDRATLPVVAGRSYVVAASWSRRFPTSATWADLDLRVRLDGVVLGESLRRWDSNERVAFTAPSTGTAELEVTAAGFEPGTAVVDFGLAAFEASSAGAIARYGQGCAGASRVASLRMTEPIALPPGQYGNASSDMLLGNVHHRVQHLYDMNALLAAYHVQALAFRYDDVLVPNNQRHWVEIEIDLGTTLRAPAQMSTSFQTNRDRIVSTVVQRRRVVLPARTAPSQSPTDWAVVIGLDQPFHRVFDPQPGQNTLPAMKLLLEVRKYDSSLGTAPVPYDLDAVNDPRLWVSTLWATSPTATTGTLMPGIGTVVGLADGHSAVVPVLAGSGIPALGQTYVVALSGAPALASTVLEFGLSDTQLGGLRLPLSLEPIGAPRCWLLTSLDASATQPTDATGAASVPVPVPNLAALYDARLHHQMLVFDPAANELGAVVSNALRVVIGR